MTIITTTKTMRPRHEFDFYPTPTGLIEASLQLARHEIHIARQPEFVLDPGAGNGVWGDVFRKQYPYSKIAGTDLRPLSRPASYDYWQAGVDFRGITPAPVFDWIVGNPPYKFAEDFVRIGYDMLMPNGMMIYLLRLAFLEGQKRANGLWKTHPPKHVAVCGRRPSFTGNGKTDATAYAVFYWVKGWEQHCTPSLSWLTWDDEPLTDEVQA